MKSLSILLFISSILFSQQIKITALHTFSDTTKLSKVLKKFEDKYESAGNIINKDKIAKSFYEFKADFQQYIKDSLNNLADNTRLWIRVGCELDGSFEEIQYSSKGIAKQNKTKRFEELLTKYFSNHKYGLKCNQKYGQCGSLKLKENISSK